MPAKIFHVVFLLSLNFAWSPECMDVSIVFGSIWIGFVADHCVVVVVRIYIMLCSLSSGSDVSSLIVVYCRKIDKMFDKMLYVFIVTSISHR